MVSYFNRCCFIVAAFLLILIISSCAQKPQNTVREAIFIKSSFQKLTGWSDDRHIEAFYAFLHSCDAIMKKRPQDMISNITDIGGKASNWQKICAHAYIEPIQTSKDARLFFEKNFHVYAVKDKQGGDLGTMTGYYEIELNGSRKKTKKYQYPIYRTPPDIERLKGCNNFCHASINNGALHNKKLEIAWVDSRARAFFLHIQGSGIIKLGNGKEVKVGYDRHNGMPYTGIGSLMKKYGAPNACTATQIMEWIDKNPRKGRKLIEENKSYVFFREIDGKSPIGAQGIPLHKERSLAIDARFYPYGTLFWTETKLAKTSYTGKNAVYNRLMIGQDTGGAIRGPIRADIFFGRGKKAEALASAMKSPGRYYIITPKSVIMPKMKRVTY